MSRFIFIGLLGVVSACAVLLILRRARLRLAMLKNGCAKCGYSTQGLTGSVCPECGYEITNLSAGRNSISGRIRTITIGMALCVTYLIASIAITVIGITRSTLNNYSINDISPPIITIEFEALQGRILRQTDSIIQTTTGTRLLPHVSVYDNIDPAPQIKWFLEGNLITANKPFDLSHTEGFTRFLVRVTDQNGLRSVKSYHIQVLNSEE